MTLASLLAAGPIVAPGVSDALTAAIAEQAGFAALYVSGAAIAYTRLGRPDIGLVSMAEVAETVALIRDRVAAELIVDADDGYGNALNVQRTVRAFERAGAGAIQIEDQAAPKRCGHLRDKRVIPAAEMVGKLRAALDVRRGALIVARTDAAAMEGLDAAIDRARQYAQAGADLIFVEAPRSEAELRRVADALAPAWLVANMVDGGDTPMLPAAALGAIGFRLVIFPGGIVRAQARAAQAYYRSLAEHGSNAPLADRMFDFAGLNELIGTPEMLTLGARYAAPAGTHS